MVAVYFGAVSETPLLGQSAPAYILTTSSDVTFTFNTPIPVTANQVYTFAIMSDDILYVYENLGTGERDHNGSNYASGFSDPFAYIWVSDPNGAMSIFAICNKNTPTNPPTLSNPLQH